MLKVKSKSSNDPMPFQTLLICNILTFGWPVFEMVIASLYKNKISCTAIIVVNISEWLIIKGVLSFLLKLSITMYLYYGKTSLCNCLSIISGYIINLIIFSWLIIGSLLFWRECYNLEPNIVNITMWISLIFGFVSTLNFKSTINSIDSFKEENKKTPILDIA
jgi:hypothetical protein